MTEHASLTAALAAFQAELPDVSKGSTNPAFRSKYADLADVVKTVLPLLAKQGLAWVTAPDITDHGPVLRYELRHTSGDTITGMWPLPESAKAQELGSWITYGRRYTLGAVTGIAPDEDDDGNTAKSKPSPRAVKATAAERIERAAAAIRATSTHAELGKVWDDVARSGLEGRHELIDAKAAKVKELGPAETTTDAWAVADVPK